MKLHAKSFSLVMVIVALVVLTGLALGSWLIWQKNNGKTPRDTRGDNNQTTPPAIKDPDPSEGGKYLVIKEWGIRFPLPEELRGDIAYAIEARSDGTQVAWFEVNELASLPGSQCVLTTFDGASGKGIGAFLIRTEEKIPSAETAKYYAPSTNIRIEPFWFAGGRERYSETCINDDSKTQMVADIRSSLVYQFEKIEKAKD